MMKPLFDKIDKKEAERSHDWFISPHKGIGFSKEQLDFMEKHGIAASTAYIGMIRFYKDNRTIFQSSAFAPIYAALDGKIEPEYDQLSKLAKEYVDYLMLLSPEALEIALLANVPLLA